MVKKVVEKYGLIRRGKLVTELVESNTFSTRTRQPMLFTKTDIGYMPHEKFVKVRVIYEVVS